MQTSATSIVQSKGFLTPLMRACAIGNSRSVQYLIENGADVNERGPRNSTALMYAAGGGFTDIVRILVERGADVSVREEGGWTALSHAKVDGYVDVVSLLESIESTAY